MKTVPARLVEMLSESPEKALPQLHPTDRSRGGIAFVETRSGAYYGKLGYLAGLGHSSMVIAGAMGDGIHPSYVRTILKRWGVPRHDPFCQVPMTDGDRYALAYRAEQAGISPEEWLQRIIHCAVQENQYLDITDGRYEPKPARTKKTA